MGRTRDDCSNDEADGNDDEDENENAGACTGAGGNGGDHGDHDGDGYTKQSSRSTKPVATGMVASRRL